MVSSANAIFSVLFLAGGVLNYLSGVPVDSLPTAPPDCSKAALDGMLEFGCWGYIRCVNGVASAHFCQADEVFERNTRSCVPKGTRNNDCGKHFSCLGKADGHYADWNDTCQTYVTCLGEINLGRQYCSANLVFNETIQACDFAWDVDPPCGIKQARARDVIVG